MDYNTYSSNNLINSSSPLTETNDKFSVMNITNLDEIEEHYSDIFFKVVIDPYVFVFDGQHFVKADNCNLFLKYTMNVLEYYRKLDEQNREITVILDLKNVNNTTLNIDFLMKFVKKFKSVYENKIILRKFYIINCPNILKKVYLFVRPFLHPDTIKKMQVIKEDKSVAREYYYVN
jgi:hypothetical protein